jgi:hypothetical protein
MKEADISAAGGTRAPIALPSGFVSPELVLVDPELAELARLALPPLEGPVGRSLSEPQAPSTLDRRLSRLPWDETRKIALGAAGAAVLAVVGFLLAARGGDHARQGLPKATPARTSATLTELAQPSAPVVRAAPPATPTGSRTRPAVPGGGRTSLVRRDALAGVRIGAGPQQVVHAWGPPAATRQVKVDARALPVVQLTWRTKVGHPWAADAYFRANRAVLLRLTLRGASARTPAGDRAGTSAKAFLRHWPDAGRVPSTSRTTYYYVRADAPGYFLVFTFVRDRLTRVALMTRSMFTGCNSAQC